MTIALTFVSGFEEGEERVRRIMVWKSWGGTVVVTERMRDCREADAVIAGREKDSIRDWDTD